MAVHSGPPSPRARDKSALWRFTIFLFLTNSLHVISCTQVEDRHSSIANIFSQILLFYPDLFHIHTRTKAPATVAVFLALAPPPQGTGKLWVCFQKFPSLGIPTHFRRLAFGLGLTYSLLLGACSMMNSICFSVSKM